MPPCSCSGSDKDAASLEFSLRKLGFDVRLSHNCTATFMRQELFKAARADHSTADCFVCVILSHGDEGTVYAVDKALELDALIQPFKQNRTLAGKPKLFFIQACRGSSFMEGIDSNPYEISYVNKVSCPLNPLSPLSPLSPSHSSHSSNHPPTHNQRIKPLNSSVYCRSRWRQTSWWPTRPSPASTRGATPRTALGSCSRCVTC